MDGAVGGDGDAREPADQALADFASTPAGVLLLHVQDKVLRLKRMLVGIAIGTAAPVGQSLSAALLIAIENLVACLARDSKLPAQFRHGLAGGGGSHKLKPFIHHRTLLPRYRFLPKKRRKCNPCVRYNLSPMCRVTQTTT